MAANNGVLEAKLLYSKCMGPTRGASPLHVTLVLVLLQESDPVIVEIGTCQP